MRFSVVIPNYNRSQELIEAIKSVLRQSVQADEIIVIDDRSTSVIDYKKIAKLDKRIRILFNSDNLGVGGSRNVGYSVAKNDLILFLDSDDLWCVDKIKNVSFFVDNNPVVVHAFTNKVNSICKKSRKFKLKSLKGFYPLIKNHVQGSCICINRKLFDRIKPFDENFRYSEDYDFYLRCRRENYDIVYLNSVLTELGRPNGDIGGLSSSYSLMRNGERQAIKNNIDNEAFKFLLIMITYLKQIRRAMKL